MGNSRTTQVDGRRGRGGGGGAEIVGYAVRGQCGHHIAIIRRAGEDDDGDRDCVLVVRGLTVSDAKKRLFACKP